MRDLKQTGDTIEFAEEWFTKNAFQIQKVGKPLRGAIEKLKNIIAVFEEDNIEINIVTLQSTEGAIVATEQWIRKQGLKDIEVKFVTSWEDKWNYADILIDDSIDVLKAKPENKVAIKVAYPWNKDVNGFVNVDTVEQITYENIMDAITLFKLFQL